MGYLLDLRRARAVSGLWDVTPLQVFNAYIKINNAIINDDTQYGIRKRRWLNVWLIDRYIWTELDF